MDAPLLPPQPDVPSRAESSRILVEGLRALAQIVEHVSNGAQQPLPATQSCHMAALAD
jgi:hypothetical protein